MGMKVSKNDCPVGWGCTIHWLLLCWEVRHTHNEFPGYDTKEFDGEVPVMLELRGMLSTSSLTSLPGPLESEEAASERVQSMCQIRLNCIVMLNWIVWNRTVLTFKVRIYAKLNCLKWNCFCTLNWKIHIKKCLIKSSSLQRRKKRCWHHEEDPRQYRYEYLDDKNQTEWILSSRRHNHRWEIISTQYSK